MATIKELPTKDGSFTYHVQIRKPRREAIYRSFHTKEDAELYVFYKERLLDNMDSFDVPIADRVNLEQIMELKIRNSQNIDPKTKADILNAFAKLFQVFERNKIAHFISYEEWFEAAKTIFNTETWKGGKNNTLQMKPRTLRRIFASISSSFSYAQSQGIAIENYPLRVMKTYINPMCEKDEKNALN